MQLIPPALEGVIPTTAEFQTKSVSVKTLHRVSNDNQTNETFALSLNEESEGTKNLFALSPVLKSAFENGRIICVDELDTSCRFIFSSRVNGILYTITPIFHTITFEEK